MSFKIGSINMYKFNNRTDREISKNIGKIVSLIRTEEFDVIGLQEVLNEAAVKRMIKELPGWDYIWQSPKSRSQQAAEGYAFIWNTKRFRIATGRRKEERNNDNSDITAHRSFTPRIHSQYDSDSFLFQGKLIRDPLYARFESVYGWYELRLINTHIIYNDKKSEDDEGEKDKRRRELEILLEIYHQIETKQYRNKRTAYTLLLGDYNLSLKDITKLQNIDKTKSNDYEVHKIIVDRNNQTETILSVQHELSTLKKNIDKSDSDKKDNGYANNYDHFSFSEEIRESRKVDLHCERIDSVNKYWSKNLKIHRKEFSDHTPIKLTGEFK